MLGYSDVKSFVEVATPAAAEGTILFDTLVDPQNDGAKGIAELVAGEIRPALPNLRLFRLGHAVHPGRGHPQGEFRGSRKRSPPRCAA